MIWMWTSQEWRTLSSRKAGELKECTSFARDRLVLLRRQNGYTQSETMEIYHAKFVGLTFQKNMVTEVQITSKHTIECH